MKTASRDGLRSSAARMASRLRSIRYLAAGTVALTRRGKRRPRLTQYLSIDTLHARCCLVRLAGTRGGQNDPLLPSSTQPGGRPGTTADTFRWDFATSEADTPTDGLGRPGAGLWAPRVIAVVPCPRSRRFHATECSHDRPRDYVHTIVPEILRVMVAVRFSSTSIPVGPNPEMTALNVALLGPLVWSLNWSCQGSPSRSWVLV